MSFIRGPWIRIPSKLALALGLAYLALVAEFRNVSEKWRIRHAWTSKNWDSLTESQKQASITDGANLTIEPFVYAIGTLFAFVVVAILMNLLFHKTRLNYWRTPKKPEEPTSSEEI